MVESVEMEEMMMVMKMIMKTKMKTFNQSSLDFCVKALLRHVYNLYSLSLCLSFAPTAVKQLAQIETQKAEISWKLDSAIERQQQQLVSSANGIIIQ